MSLRGWSLIEVIVRYGFRLLHFEVVNRGKVLEEGIEFAVALVPFALHEAVELVSEIVSEIVKPL